MELLTEIKGDVALSLQASLSPSFLKFLLTTMEKRVTNQAWRGWGAKFISEFSKVFAHYNGKMSNKSGLEGVGVNLSPSFLKFLLWKSY